MSPPHSRTSRQRGCALARYGCAGRRSSSRALVPKEEGCVSFSAVCPPRASSMRFKPQSVRALTAAQTQNASGSEGDSTRARTVHFPWRVSRPSARAIYRQECVNVLHLRACRGAVSRLG